MFTRTRAVNSDREVPLSKTNGEVGRKRRQKETTGLESIRRLGTGTGVYKRDHLQDFKMSQIDVRGLGRDVREVTSDGLSSGQ